MKKFVFILFSVLVMYPCMSAFSQGVNIENVKRNLMKADKSEDVVDERVTLEEIEPILRQLGRCWLESVKEDKSPRPDTIVEIKLTINPDRTVHDARIVDQIRYSQDSFFRAAADSAYRAVFQTACNPLLLPPEKYNEWNTMTVRFDPREML